MQHLSPTKRAGTSQKGFTLIEIMVSVTLFAIVMTVSMGAILSIINSDRKAQAIKSVMDNLDSAVENMTRTIKTGYSYSIDSNYPGTGDCNNPTQVNESNAIKVGNAIVQGVVGDSVTYALGSVSGGQYSPTGNQIVKIVSGDPNSANNSANTVTAPEVTIERMCFYVSGNSVTPDHEQPEVIMVLEGYAGTLQSKTNFNLQSAISQRLLDS